MGVYMKKLFMFVCLSIGSHTNGALAANAVEYVRICSLYGAGYHYIPGTDTCLQETTGITKKATENGTVVGESKLARRVAQLEAQIAFLSKQLGLEDKE